MKHFHCKRIVLSAGLTALLLSGTALASPTLQQGSHGHDVLVLQQKLNKIGYNVGSADGIYGQGTEQAVAEFHIVNNSTWRALLKAKKRPWGSQVQPPVRHTPAKSQPGTGWTQRSRELAPNGTPILPRSKVNDLIFTAKKYMGTPYLFGGSTPKAFDCSGYLQYIFRENGIIIPRTADVQTRSAHHEFPRARTRRPRLLHNLRARCLALRPIPRRRQLHPRLLQPRRPRRQPQQHLLGAQVPRRQTYRQIKKATATVFFVAVTHQDYAASCSIVFFDALFQARPAGEGTPPGAIPSLTSAGAAVCGAMLLI